MRVRKYSLQRSDELRPILVKENSQNWTEASCLKDPWTIARMLQDVFHLDHMAEEYLYLIAIDNKCHLLGVSEVSHGTIDRSLVNPREILIRALLLGASGIVIAHNHPSGDITPSQEDISVTKRVKGSCELIGLNFFDHIIIGDRDYCSMSKANLL